MAEMMVNEVENKKKCLASLPPGVRFHPTDEELIVYYLKKKIFNNACVNLAIIAEIDIYKWDPEQLPGLSVLKNGDKKWYFFCKRERKYPKGSRASRQTANGYWKITGRDRNITYKSQIVGSKKTLVFYRGRAPSAGRTDWVIQEYTLDQQMLGTRRQADKDMYVLCKFYKKNGSGPMHPNDFGAAYNDDEWDDGENLVEDNETNREKLVCQLNGYATMDISPVHNQCHNLAYGEEEISMDIEEKPIVNLSHENNSHAERPLAQEFLGPQPMQMQLNENEGTVSSVEHRGDDIIELQKKIDALQEDLEETKNEVEYLEGLNQALLVKDNMSNRELQDARKEFIYGLQDYLSLSSGIGIKQVGEIDRKPFIKVCYQNFPEEEREEKANDLLSFWQQEVSNPEWYPFKRITIFGKMQEALDTDDERLVKLQEEWGRDVYEAVATALMELNEHNGSGRYIFPELWNFDKKRKASLKEAINYSVLLLEFCSHKRRR